MSSSFSGRINLISHLPATMRDSVSMRGDYRKMRGDFVQRNFRPESTQELAKGGSAQSLR